MPEKGIEASGWLTLTVVADDSSSGAEDARLKIEAPGVDGWVIGRSDHGGVYQPDVDLAPYSARQKGISRRHAVLVRYRGQVHLLDLGSMNGTYVNDERLWPQVAVPLNSGDKLRFANLSLIITQ